MSNLPLSLLRTLQKAPSDEAWKALLEHAWTICSSPLPRSSIGSEVTRRDRALAPVDLFLATAAWDLWTSWNDSVPRVADLLVAWWRERSPGRAVLLLDGLSLREVPWLLEGARERGYRIHRAEPAGAELPTETTPFARALGFPGRSALANNGTASRELPGATTDSVGLLPWRDCLERIGTATDFLLWHAWPDDRLHVLKAPGHGLTALAEEAAGQLADDEFWALVERLTTGRRLVITSDHGYAASGLFSDVSDKEQVGYLRSRFQSSREAVSAADPGPWVPPLDLVLDTPSGRHAFVVGRRKWKSPGGYPTLSHGGLTLLEVVVPFVEVSRPDESA